MLNFNFNLIIYFLNACLFFLNQNWRSLQVRLAVKSYGTSQLKTEPSGEHDRNVMISKDTYTWRVNDSPAAIKNIII